MVKYENVTVRYGSHTVVENFSLEVHKGEILGIVGPSGCGKTTLVRALGGFLNPDHGEISINGELVYSKAKRINRSPEARRLGIVFQDYAVWPHLSVWDNVMYPLKKRRVPKDKAAEMVRHALEQVRMKGYEKYMPSQLSGGQQQRVAIARSLVNEPEILLLDEPLGALDLKLRKEMQLELKRLQREMNITFVYVTHDQEEALTMSDTVVVMNGGKVQQIGTPEDIYNEPKNAFVADFIGDSNIVDGVMHRDFLVSFSGVEFPCVDRGFAREQSVQVVVRPEDIEVVSPMEGQLVGVVNDVIFKGVHFEMHVECEGREWLIHSTRACTPGETIGMKIGPNEIHIMARS